MPNIRLVAAFLFSLVFSIAVQGQNPGELRPNVAGTAPVPGAIPGPGVAKEEPATPAEEILDAAIVRLKKIVSFSADIVQTVDMLDQKFEIKGLAVKASNHRIYLKLDVSGLGDTPATTLQVCDGTTLWECRQVLDTQSVTKLTIPTILKKLDDPVLDGSPFREAVSARIGFAGPEAMLAGLRKTVRFDQKSEEVLDGKKVWVIRGQWKDRSGLVGPGQQPPSATVPLPPYIPSNVYIWISQDDRWPLKIEMVGNAVSMLGQQPDYRKRAMDGSPMGPKITPPKLDPSRIVLVYTNIKINPELKPTAFDYEKAASATNVRDDTDDLLAFLDRAIQAETTRKKAEAAKSDVVLPGVGIEVPKADSGPAAPADASPNAAPAPERGPEAPVLSK